MKMVYGHLSELFTGAISKRLSFLADETQKPNQGAFLEPHVFRDLLGDKDQDNIPTRFFILTDDRDDFFIDCFLFWRNESKGKPSPPKNHLYYSGNDLTQAMRIGDRMFLARLIDGKYLVMIVPDASTINSQLRWLFGFLDENGNEPQFREFSNNNSPKLDFAARFILNKLHIDFEEQQTNLHKK